MSKQNPNPLTRLPDDYGDQADGQLGSQLKIGGGNFMTNASFSEDEKQSIIKYIDELKYADKRDNALIELSRQREHFAELAPFIWHSVGTIAALLQEIVSVYPQLSPPNLDTKTSNKACNVLALLQCVASHKETRQLFLKAHIPLFLYPFLNTVSKGRPFEYLRLTSLGVIGALVKMDDSDVINFLLQTEIIPLCLRIMERGTELSQTVATFIIQKILLDDQGLSYLCQTAERFFAVSTVLNNMVVSQMDKPSSRLLKHIIRCYTRICENPRALIALRENMPTILKDNQRFLDNLDDSSKKQLKNLSDQILNTSNSGLGISDDSQNSLLVSQPSSISAHAQFNQVNSLQFTQQQQQQLQYQQQVQSQQQKSQQEQIQNIALQRQKTPVQENFNQQFYQMQQQQQNMHQQAMFLNRPPSTVSDKGIAMQQQMVFQRQHFASPPPVQGHYTPQPQQMMMPTAQHQMYYQQAQPHHQGQILMPQPTHQQQPQVMAQNFIPQLHSASPHQAYMMQNSPYQQQQQQQQQFQHYFHQTYTDNQAQMHQYYTGPNGAQHFNGNQN